MRLKGIKRTSKGQKVSQLDHFSLKFLDRLLCLLCPHFTITSLYILFLFRAWTVPLPSSHIQAAVNYRSPEERLAMFSQLELWLANTIRRQVVEQGDMGDMEDPQHTARFVHFVYRGSLYHDAL